ncbi:unnamed protein product [Bursaphelenchus xylophilus]|uniref:(pine wood nematode) hypothetical protein n=1 Tax=Bursaphelenchus xylophilus TaxID=6326 RepID=A0A1I7S2T2_BURXY|nr:unnamed protein product [Bursaphelenchus xylophilus]CAG9121631.1 unnamed protein product [Bursaphelenchus xylophilus]
MFGANSAPSSSSGGLPPASELLSPPTNGNSYNRHLPPTSPQMAPPSPYIGTPGHYQSLTEPGTPVFLNPASVGDPVASPSYESMSPASFTNQSAGSTKPSTPMADQASPAAYGQYANQPYYPPHYQSGRLPPAESLPITSNFGPRPQNFPRKPPPRPGPPHPQGDSTLRQQLSRPLAHKAAPIDKRRHTISSQRTLPPLQQPLSVPPPSDHQPYYPPNGPKSVPNNFDPDRPSSHPSNHHSEPFEHDFEGHMSNEFDQYLPPAPLNQYYPQSPVPDPTYQQLETFQPENFPEFPEYPQDQFYDPQGNFIGSEVPYNVHQGPPPYDPNYPPGPSRLAGPQQVVYHSTGPNGQPQTVVHTVVDPQNYENGALRPEDPPNRPKTSSPKKGKKKAENDNGEPKPKPKRIRKSAAQLRAEKAAREAAALEAQAAQNGIATNPMLANPHERIQIHNGQITRQPVQNANGTYPQPQNLDQRPIEEIVQPSGDLDDSASLMPPPKVDRAPSVLAAKAAATEIRPAQSSQILTNAPPTAPGMGQSPGPAQMQSPIPSPNFHGPNGYNSVGMPNNQGQISSGSSPVTPIPPGLPVSGPMAPAYTSQTGSVQTGPTYSGSHGICSTPGQAQVTGPHGSGYHPGPAASPVEYRAPPFGSHGLPNSPYGHPQVGQYGQELDDQELAMDRATPGFADDASLANMDYNSQGSQGSAHDASQHGSAGSRTPSSTREEPHGELEAVLTQEQGKKLPPKRVRTAAHRAEIQRQKFLKQREHEWKQARENHQYLVRYMQLRKMVRALVFTNTALADEVSRVKTQIDVVTEQRKLVAKEVRHCERKRIRRMQTHERKARALKAKLEAAEQSGLNNLPFQAEPDSSTNNSFTYPLHLDTRPTFDPRSLTVKQEMASPGIRGISGNGLGTQKVGIEGQGEFGDAGTGGNPSKFQLQSPQQAAPARQGNGTARPQSEGKTGKGKRAPKPRKRPNPEQLSEESPQPAKKKRLKKLEPLTVDTNFAHADQERDNRLERGPNSANRRLSSASQPSATSPDLSADLASPKNLNNWPTDQIFLSPTELEPTAEVEPNLLQNFIPMERYNRAEESPQRRSEEAEKTTPGSNDSVRTRFSARLKRQSQSELPASPRSRTQSRSQISPRTPSAPAKEQNPQSANGNQSRDQSRRSSETPQARSRTHSNSVQNKSTTSQLQAQIKTEAKLAGPTGEKPRNLSGTPRVTSRNEKTPIKPENLANPGQVQTRNSAGAAQNTILSTTPAKERPLPSPIKLNPTPDELKEMKFEPHPEPTESTLDQFDEDRSYKSTPTLLEPPIQLPEPKRRTSSRQSKKRQSITPTSLTESPSTSSCTSPIPLGEGTIVTRRKAAEAASLATTPTMQTRSKRKLHAS